MVRSNKRLIVTFAVLVFGFLCAHAHAIPSSDLSYIETDLGNNLWRYDYTLFNTSDPFANAGSDLYDFTLYFDAAAVLNIVSLPDGWDYVGGTFGVVESFSLNPGAAPFGTDIAPGESLGGFSFIFDYRAGSLLFDATLFNPNDPSNPAVYTSNTVPASAPVPEPATLLMLGSGLMGLAALRKRFPKT